VLTPSFFARHDTRTPVKVAMAAMALNVALNLALMHPLKHVGMALATAIAAWFNLALLGWHLKRLGHFALDARLKARFWRILGSCLAMSGALWAAQTALAPLWAQSRLLTLLLLIGLGLAVYGGAMVLSGGMTQGELRAALRRKAD
jgi:putative peptidoglycan lipid II flippase